MYFLLTISSYGQPGNLVGPVEWGDGVSRIMTFLGMEDEDGSIGQSVEETGCYEHDDGGGIYLLAAESP